MAEKSTCKLSIRFVTWALAFFNYWLYIPIPYSMSLPLSLLTALWLSFLYEKTFKGDRKEEKALRLETAEFFNLILEKAQCYVCHVMPGTQNNTATTGGEKTKKGGSLEATLEADFHGVHMVSSARGRLMMKNLWGIKGKCQRDCGKGSKASRNRSGKPKKYCNLKVLHELIMIRFINEIEIQNKSPPSFLCHYWRCLWERRLNETKCCENT